jgi:hypothetical protein
VVQVASGQAKEKSVKVGDVIVAINDEMVEPIWTRREVVDMIRAYTKPDSIEPLVIAFDRQFRNSSVNTIKQRVKEHKQPKPRKIRMSAEEQAKKQAEEQAETDEENRQRRLVLKQRRKEAQAALEQRRKEAQAHRLGSSGGGSNAGSASY